MLADVLTIPLLYILALWNNFLKKKKKKKRTHPKLLTTLHWGFLIDLFLVTLFVVFEYFGKENQQTFTKKSLKDLIFFNLNDLLDLFISDL